MELQYIILNGKTPTHKFKDGEEAVTWDQAKEFDNVAVIVPEGYVVLDFDTKSDAEIALNIIEGLDLKTNVIRTTRGIHAWFKTPETVKNFIKQRLAAGIYSDRKSGGRNAYVKIKQDGSMREWIRKVDAEEMEEVPPYFRSVGAPADKFDFKGMTEGSGRNQELFNYIVYLQGKGFKKDEIKETIRVINDYVFADPLPESELATILRDEAFKPDEEIEKEKSKDKKKSIYIPIANKIIEEHNLLKYNGVVYEYLDGYYQPAEFLRRYIRETLDGATNRDVNEIASYIGDMREVKSNSIKTDPYIINVRNTRLDLRTEKRLDFTSQAMEFNQLPVVYDPDAYCKELDEMLTAEFSGDQELIDLFCEMIGSILLKHSKYQKAFLFYGSGANGKSTLLNLIKTFLGSDNYSAMSLEDVAGRFNKAELENKLANIGDDVNNTTLRDTGTLKKLFAGNSLMAERKGGRPFTIEPYATHIYSCNVIPRSFDKSEGFYRRWILIPLSAEFKPGEEGYDPFIEDKITTDNALSYLLNLGIAGAERLIHNGRFTEPESTKAALAKYRTENSSVLSWIEDEDLDENYFLDNPRDLCYSEYKDWSVRSGVDKAQGKQSFNREVVRRFDFDPTPQLRHNRKRYFVVKI